MTLDELAARYFQPWELRWAKRTAPDDPLKELVHTSKEMMRGIIGGGVWIQTEAGGKVKVYLNHRSPTDKLPPDIDTTIERLAQIALAPRTKQRKQLSLF